MSFPSFLVDAFQAIENTYHRHPFIFIFFSVTIVFTTLSIILVTIANGDPDNHTSSLDDEEQRLFLPRDPDFLYSPSGESANSPVMDSRSMSGDQEGKISEANVERLLAAHRDHVAGRFSEIWDNRIYFRFEPRDALLRMEEGVELEDEDVLDVHLEQPKVSQPHC